MRQHALLISSLVAAGAVVASCSVVNAPADPLLGTGGAATTTTTSVGGEGGTGLTSGGGGVGNQGGTGGDPKLGLGSPCQSPAECQSAFCVDEVCCVDECAAPCFACNLDDAGQCQPSPPATPEGECGPEAVCDGAGECALGGHEWSLSFGGADYDEGHGVAVDGQGNVIVTGTFSGTMAIGTTNLMSAGSGDIFLAKFAPDGSNIWATSFGGTSNDAGWDVAVDGSGNIGLTGEFGGTMQIGSNMLVSGGNDDAFVAKFLPTGNVLWADGYGDPNAQRGKGVAFSPDGDMVVVGEFDGSIDFGGPLLSTNTDNVFMVKLDPAGNHKWSYSFGDNVEYQEGWRVVVDDQNYVTIMGMFQGTLDFGGPILDAGSGDGCFVARFNNNAVHQFSRAVTTTGSMECYGLAVDSEGETWLAGGFDGTGDLGQGAVPSVGIIDWFLVKYALDGEVMLSKSFGNAGSGAVGVGIDVDSRRNLFAGVFYQGGPMDFGAGPMGNQGGAALVKYSADGTFLFGHPYEAAGGNPTAVPYALKVGVDDMAVVSGFFSGSINFGGSPLGSVSSDPDVFVAKFTP